jgi:hypothetical protein
MARAPRNPAGAVKDIQYAVDKLGIAENELVLAGDNVLDFSPGSFRAVRTGEWLLLLSCAMRKTSWQSNSGRQS